MKNKRADEKYLSQRKKFSEATGPRELWSVIDQWPLYAGMGNIARYFASADLLRMTLDVPGHVVEFGSWRGGNLMLLAKLLKIYDSFGPKLVHCFDSFSGLTEFSDEDGKATDYRGMYRGSLEELTDLIELYDLQDDIVIHQGLVEEKLHAVLSDDPALSFSMVYCDLDLYEGTKTILEGVHDRLSVRGLIAFDQWNESLYPGETVAAREFLKRHGNAYEMINLQHTIRPSLVLKKISHD